MLINVAPKKIAGHKRPPKRKSATNAIPVGGQTRVAKPLTGDRLKPALAVAK
jgi:hypothetical protein